MFAVKEVMWARPELVWPFILRWGRHRSKDLRSAVACVLLEHLLEWHGRAFLPRVRAAARGSPRFAWAVLMCEPYGPERRRLVRLQADIRRWRARSTR